MRGYNIGSNTVDGCEYVVGSNISPRNHDERSNQAKLGLSSNVPVAVLERVLQLNVASAFHTVPAGAYVANPATSPATVNSLAIFFMIPFPRLGIGHHIGFEKGFSKFA
jgi:hypothetical protein